jgi:hypothetical protein
MKYLLAVLGLIVSALLWGQTNQMTKPIPARVLELQTSGVEFVEVKPFRASQSLEPLNIPYELRGEARELIPDMVALKWLDSHRPSFLKLHIPRLNGDDDMLLLYQVMGNSGDIDITYSDGTSAPQLPGTHYRGILYGDYQSLVAISFYDDYLMGFVSSQNGNMVLGPIDDKRMDNPNNLHLFFNDGLISHLNPFVCKYDELDQPESDYSFHIEDGQRGPGDCVKIYYEVNFNIWQDKGANTLSYITGLLNQVYTLYSNDGIEVSTSQLKIWNTPSPYIGPSDANYLDQFRIAMNGNFNGDLAHLLTYGTGGGLAYVNVLCNKQWGVGMSNIESSFDNVPTYSWSVSVITHELGHNLGSPHTHDCAWNGNNTRIDNCGGNAGYPSGNCNSNPPDPPIGGTIMSYCHLRPVGINFSNGFGPQPTALIANRINSANCLSSCMSCDFTITCPPTTTVQCGANPPPSVTGNPTINIISGSCSPTVTFTDNNNGLTGCNGTGFFVRTFTATFGAITRTCNQTINKIDNTPPVINGVPANTSINCASPIPAPSVVTATDNCGAATLTYVQTSTPPTCGYTITRTWTAVDACGNSTARTQLITVVDNTPPVALCKSHSVILNAQGQAGITPADINNGSFDGCGGPVTLSVNPATLTCTNLGTANVVLTVTDGCGLVSTCNAAVTVIDNYPPKMICRGLELEINEAGDPVAITWQDIDDGSTDNCAITQWTLSKSIFTCDDLGKNTVKLTGADASGNASTCQVTVTVRDLIPPIFTYVPEDITVFCVEPKPEDPPVVYDNCGDVNLLMTEEQLLWPGGPANSYRVRRHWTAMDKAGNMVEEAQLISVRTQGDLAVLCTPDVWTAASRSPIQAWWEAPRVSDACLGTFPMIQVGGPVAGSFFNPGSRTRIAYEFVNDEGIRYQCAFHVVVPGLGEDYRVVINQVVVDCEDYRLRHCDVSNLAGQQVAFSWRPHGSQAPEEFGFDGADARLEVFADGTARLQGHLQNLGGVVAGWIVDLRFYHRRNAAGWQSVGGKSFNPMGVATTAWDYFELDPSQSILIGTGAYAGMIRTVRSSIIYTAHGLQTGPGAAGIGTGPGAWVALATYNDAGKLTGQGEIRFAIACNNTPAIMDAGNFLALDGQSYQVQWSNGVNGPIMGPAPAGSYQVQVTGPSGQVNTHAFALVAPTGCVNLWQDACRERNMAIGAQASQSSTWQGAQASRAVDGNTDGQLSNGSVSSTLQGWQNFWQARLKEPHLIQSIRLWPRTDCCSDQLNDHRIFISANPIPNMSPEDLMTMPDIQTIVHRGRMNEAWRTTVGVAGQYVRVQLLGSGQVQLAEVEALVCQPDRLDPPNRYELGTVEQQDGRSDLAGDLLPGLLVWPNPAGEWVELRFDEQDLAPQRVIVHNLHGQEVYRLNMEFEELLQVRMSVATWPQGMYILTVHTLHGPDSRLILVQR